MYHTFKETVNNISINRTLLVLFRQQNISSFICTRLRDLNEVCFQRSVITSKLIQHTTDLVETNRLSI